MTGSPQPGREAVDNSVDNLDGPVQNATTAPNRTLSDARSPVEGPATSGFSA